MIVFTIPRMRLVNTSNVREHWSVRARRTADQRLAGKMHTLKAIGDRDIKPPYECTIIRVGPRPLDRSNLWVASKALEDGICDALGVNDGDEGAWTLQTRQEGPPKGLQGADRYAVRVEIRIRQMVAS
jgi:hypothetical protein